MSSVASHPAGDALTSLRVAPSLVCKLALVSKLSLLTTYASRLLPRAACLQEQRDGGREPSVQAPIPPPPVQLVYKSSVTGAESHMYRFRADRGLTWPMALEKYKKAVRACLEETTAARKL